METFSYDDVYNLATVTPVGTKRSVPRAEVESSGRATTATDEDKEQRLKRQQGGKGKKRAAERQGPAAEGTDT